MLSWIGSTEQELVQQNGAPGQIYDTMDGSRVLTYMLKGPNGIICRLNYTLDSQGVIYATTTKGCPN